MKKLIIPLVLSMFVFSGCGLVSKLTDLTETANQLLSNIESITRQIDAEMQSGKLVNDVGGVLDDKLQELTDILNTTIQNNGGFLFDEANGMINNVFSNVSLLLDQIKSGLLDESLPNLINQISTQLQVNINLLSSSVEDLVTLTFGNTFILVDKTTNSVVIIVSIIFLAIGLFVYAIVLIGRKERKMNLLRWIGLAFMLVYVGFFTAVILSSNLRGNLIAGFDFAQKYQGVQTEPKITGVYPESFVIGKDDKIFIYGKHLNEIDTLGIKLRTGQSDKFTFPRNNIIVQSSGRIVLGNFGGLNWKLPKFQEFAGSVTVQERSLVNSPSYQKFAYGMNDRIYEKVRPVSHMATMAIAHTEQPVVSRGVIRPISIDPSKLPMAAARIRTANLKVTYRNEASMALGVTNGNLIINALKGFYLNRFSLPEGDYALTVLSGEKVVTSPQLITIINPPPPAPLPDIFPVGIRWTDNINAVAQEQTSLEVTLGFSHPEEVKNPFTVRIASSPPITPLSFDVPMGTIAAAQGPNTVTITTRAFTVTDPGNYLMTISVDTENRVTEKNEGNNTMQASLAVKEYTYDATVTYSTFTSNENMDNGDTDEYRIDIITSVSNNPDWKINYNKDGEPGNAYSINQSRTYTNLRPGDVIMLYTTGKEADSGLRDGDDGMGAFLSTYALSSKPTAGNDTKDAGIMLTTGSYSIIGKISYTRRVK
jgi:hypothetical protein